MAVHAGQWLYIMTMAVHIGMPDNGCTCYPLGKLSTMERAYGTVPAGWKASIWIDRHDRHVAKVCGIETESEHISAV
jgi:hypothetical protein